MFAILKDIKIEKTAFLSFLFDRTLSIRIGTTEISFKAKSCSFKMAFEFHEHDEIIVKVGGHQIKLPIDSEKSTYSFLFKQLKATLKFKFAESDWETFDLKIITPTEYKDRKYYVNEQTLESRFNLEFNLTKNFPTFSAVERDGKRYYIDHVNKLVIPVNPAIRQNSVKMKIKSNFSDRENRLFLFNIQPITVDRDNLLESSQVQLLNFLKFKQIGDLLVCFKNEIGEDYGAIKREFFYLLFNLLVTDPRILSKDNILDVNPDFSCSEFLYEYEDTSQIPDILDDFIHENYSEPSVFSLLLGITIGAMLILGETIPVNFSFIFHENLLERKFTLRHIQDPEIQRNLSYLNLTEHSEVINERFFNSKKNQYDHIRFGFRLVTGSLSNLNAFDFPFIFFHFEPIMIENLKRMVKYERCNIQTREIIWLWDALKTKDQSFLSKFLLFVSGSGCIPRFDEEEFFIFDKIRYLNIPFKASVCNKRLYISDYESYEKLVYYLDLSILNTEGFHYI